jgi:hypothetical protein
MKAMNIPPLSDSARRRTVQLEALVAQVNAGGSLADWQLDRLTGLDGHQAVAARAALRMMILAEAASRRSPPATPPRRQPLTMAQRYPIGTRRGVATVSPRSRRCEPGPRF